jgi:hypothetical protein
METEILEEIEVSEIIYRPAIKINSNTNMEVLSISRNDDYTQIDFVYTPCNKYNCGWWIRIEKDSFIRVKGTTSKLKLIKAINIPFAPRKRFFKSKDSFGHFTLIFPAVPKETESIDIIECESGLLDYFNFYDVSMIKVRTEVIVCNN